MHRGRKLARDGYNIRDRAILLLFAVYGLRSGEVARLRLEDLDWVHERMTVARTKQHRSQLQRRFLDGISASL